MPFLVAAVVMVGVVCVVDLLLTYGVIRRLREHTAQLSVLGTPADASVMVQPGSTVGDFAVVADDARTLSRASLADGTLVGFFSPGCGPCEALLPTFVRRATDWRAETRPVVAVVMPGAGADAYAGRLSSAATIVVSGEAAGAVAQAFEVRGFPAVGVVDAGGVIVHSGVDLRGLPEPTRA